jgi:hypothetical protein
VLGCAGATVNGRSQSAELEDCAPPQPTERATTSKASLQSRSDSFGTLPDESDEPRQSDKEPEHDHEP